MEAENCAQTPDELIQRLHARGLTITETIKAVMRVHDLALSEAKASVVASPCWQKIVKAAEPLRAEFTD